MELSKETITTCYAALQRATFQGSEAKAVVMAMQEIENKFNEATRKEE